MRVSWFLYARYTIGTLSLKIKTPYQFLLYQGGDLGLSANQQEGLCAVLATVSVNCTNTQAVPHQLQNHINIQIKGKMDHEAHIEKGSNKSYWNEHIDLSKITYL